MSAVVAPSRGLYVPSRKIIKPMNIVWQPLPGAQRLAVSMPANHMLFAGTRGSGKTDVQLMRFRRNVGVGYGPFWRGIIFDRQYKNLDDIITKSKRWFYAFNDGAKYSGANGGGKWAWPTGEELLFRHIKRPGDYWLYHGHEYSFLGWNELTKWPTSELYDMMMSTNRTSFIPKDYPRPDGTLLPEIPLEVFSTTNPYGSGHNWVKQRFIDVALPGEVNKTVVNVFNPRTQDRVDVTKTQVHLFGSYKENYYLSPEYIADLETIQDINRKKAWLWGDWDIVSGGMFDDLWNREVHTVERFPIPKAWRLDRSFDWGSSHPFWCGWWAEANGETMRLPSGRAWTPQKGSLILLDEWYGTERIGSNKGLKRTSKQVAEGIVLREKGLRDAALICGKVLAGPADNQIRDVRDAKNETIEKSMADAGVRWTTSDKSKGSRINGIQVFRNRLLASSTGEGPGIYFMSHCKGAISTIPPIPRDEDKPEDIDTDAEDHPWDGVRYRCLAGLNRATKKLDWSMPR